MEAPGDKHEAQQTVKTSQSRHTNYSFQLNSETRAKHLMMQAMISYLTNSLC